MKDIKLALIKFTSLSVLSKSGDVIIGSYMTDQNEGMVEITKKGAKYNGTLIWTKHLENQI